MYIYSLNDYEIDKEEFVKFWERVVDCKSTTPNHTTYVPLGEALLVITGAEIICWRANFHRLKSPMYSDHITGHIHNSATSYSIS